MAGWFVYTGMIVLNCCKLVRIVPAIKFVPHGRITLHSIKKGSISLRALKENQRIFWSAWLMNYCRKARSSWRGDRAGREWPVRPSKTLKSLLETPAPGELCRRRRLHVRRIITLHYKLFKCTFCTLNYDICYTLHHRR